jgi:hypothetical protein
MTLNLAYLTNENGEKTAVQIPFDQWLLFEREYQQLIAQLNFEDGIKTAIHEVLAIQRGTQKGKTLKAMLNEL